jgi:hypothetical protein
MSLLQILSLAWGVSGREVQRTLGRGIAGFRREGRGHYRALGPITGKRLARIRPLDPRLVVAVWMSGGRTIRQSNTACSGRAITSAIEKAAPHLQKAVAVELALETRMAARHGAKRKGAWLWRPETAVAFEAFAPTIGEEIAEAERTPAFVELRAAIRRIKNDHASEPTRKQIADEMGIPLRTHVKRYSKSLLHAAAFAAEHGLTAKQILSEGIVAQDPTEALLSAMRELGARGRDCSPAEVAEELGYADEAGLFAVYRRDEYEAALKLFDHEEVVDMGNPLPNSEDAERRVDVVRPELHAKVRIRGVSRRAAKARRPR